MFQAWAKHIESRKEAAKKLAFWVWDRYTQSSKECRGAFFQAWAQHAHLVQELRRMKPEVRRQSADQECRRLDGMMHARPRRSVLQRIQEELLAPLPSAPAQEARTKNVSSLYRQCGKLMESMESLGDVLDGLEQKAAQVGKINDESNRRIAVFE